MRRKEYILIIVLVCFYSISFGQNKHFTIGFRDNGLSFGNSLNTNGIRFNLLDKDVEIINGFNIAVFTRTKITNGVSIGLATDDSISNGIKINGYIGGSKKANGIVISGLGYAADYFNGLGLGFFLAGEKLNGLFICPFGVMTLNNDEKIKLINGVAIGSFTSAEKLNGISIGIITSDIDKLKGITISINNEIEEQHGVSIGIVNKSKKLHGIQIGLWNIAENNKIFKRMPIINFNFRKNASR